MARPGAAYSLIYSSPVLSDDGRRVAYKAQSSGKSTVVVDGKEGKTYSDLAKGFLVFSADSQHVAYGAVAGDKWMVVVDGKEGKAYSALLEGSPILSSNGRRVAYGAKADDMWIVVVDENDGKTYSALTGDITFSPDSRHFAYVARVGDKWILVVDGNEQQVDLHGGIVHGATLWFDTDGCLHWLAIKGNEILQATASMQPDAKTSNTLSPSADGRIYPLTLLDPLVEAFTRFVNWNESGKFIILENGAQFVQFAGTDNNSEVSLNLRLQPLLPAQIVAASQFLRESCNAEFVTDEGFNAVLPADPNSLARLTLAVFEHVYGALPKRPVKITIDG
jgi:hypothetical protein